MSETEKETFNCDRCEMSFNSESQMNAHKVSVHAIASGEVTNPLVSITVIRPLRHLSLESRTIPKKAKVMDRITYYTYA